MNPAFMAATCTSLAETVLLGGVGVSSSELWPQHCSRPVPLTFQWEDAHTRQHMSEPRSHKLVGDLNRNCPQRVQSQWKCAKSACERTAHLWHSITVSAEVGNLKARRRRWHSAIMKRFVLLKPPVAQRTNVERAMVLSEQRTCQDEDSATGSSTCYR